MTTQQLIPLDLIDANPWQPREHEDPDAAAEIAASIESNSIAGVGTLGLLQVPMARKTHDRYQLAFGHTRKAGFALLASQGKALFEQMPLVIQELTDLQMFEAANAENIKRRDLNPIEKARAMRRYLDDFSKTSEQAADFFGVSAETVRGTVRLLGLPAPIQQKVTSGELSVSTARRLLSVQNVSPAAAIKAAEEIIEKSKDGEISTDEIGWALSSAVDEDEHLVKMWSDYEKGEPRGGRSLWPLVWQHKGSLAPLSDAELYAELGWKKSDIRKSTMTANLQALEELKRYLAANLNIDPSNFTSFGKEAVERIALLADPPKCIECPFYGKINEAHYCGLQACWNRKVEAWLKLELQRMSKKLGIAAYDPEKDGDTFLVYKDTYGDQKRQFEPKIKKQDAGLRLMVKRQQYVHPYTEHSCVAVIDVSPKAVKPEAARSNDDQKQSELRRKEEEKRDRDLKQIKMAQAWTEQVAGGQFAKALEGMTSVEVLLAFLPRCDAEDIRKDIKSLSKPKQLTQVRARIMRMLLVGDNFESVVPEPYESNSPWKKGPAGVAKYLQGVAARWSIKLPKDWLASAEEWNAEPAEEVDE